MRFRIAGALGALTLLAACAAESEWASDAEVNQSRYADGGTASVTLLTVIRNSTGEGGHTAVLIDGAERVIWDPAGTWWHPWSPERNDLHYGITPQLETHYIDYHAREAWRVVEQRIEVPQQTADAMIAAFAANGAAGWANCARVTSDILRDYPGFETIRSTWFPVDIMEDFAALPGVTTTTYFDDDDLDRTNPLRVVPGGAG
ncbi:hypothetical protein PVW48_08275 [Dinoroseobacter sp. PD6]|uniref:hypothetical protein n=1 Tax=Dinoroseobacter sp. PD6 TaxID=3028384 RepID=UPI00237BB4D2|nr:hypothetical protein [Dinoroseobacter sp. PD6]MDD9716735.1 hypothetical protein [Dinoroseobacter sp. PD6]